MVSTRIRLHAMLEWLVAAGCVASVVAAAGVVSREGASRVQPFIPVIAGEAFGAGSWHQPPAIVPHGAVSVPVLILPDGSEITVGLDVTAVEDIVSPRARVGAEFIEHDQSGRRQAQAYSYAGMNFVVVSAGGVVTELYR